MNRKTVWLANILAACAVNACGGDSTNNTTPAADSGSPVDTGSAVTDTGTATDRGTATDTGARDAGTADAGAARLSVVAGRHCTTDDMCSTDSASLNCVPLPGGQVCTGGAGCDQGTVSD